MSGAGSRARHRHASAQVDALLEVMDGDGDMEASIGAQGGHEGVYTEGSLSILSTWMEHMEHT